MQPKVMASYRMRIAVGSTLVTLLVCGSAAAAAAQEPLDSATLVRRDRILKAIRSDITPPPEGFYQTASNAQFFAQLRWTSYRSWLITDDQRFETEGTFGPVAKITPSDSLEDFTERDFDLAGSRGVLVGAIIVDTTDGAILPDSYDRLNLSAGRNCIRLRKQSDTSWFAYVFPERATGPDLCKAPTPLPVPLRVVRVRPVPTAGPRNVPAVARWHEGRQGKRSRMNFGIKCVDFWCIALNSQGDTVGLPHKAMHAAVREWQTHGWHDVQRLAVMDGPRAVPGHTKATIVPVPNLARYTAKQDFDTGWVRVATVVVHGSLSGRMEKYGRPPTPGGSGYWGFMQGENYIYLRTTTDRSYPSGWKAEVRNSHSDTSHELLVMERDDHSTMRHRLPGTARFRWLDTDDGDWIECDNGCCKIGVF